MLVAVLVLLILVLAVQLWAWLHPRSGPVVPLLERGFTQSQVDLKEEMARGRAESGAVARQLREEVQAAVRDFGGSVQATMIELADLQANQLQGLAARLDQQQVNTRGEVHQLM
jgi:hypothetical protein